MDVLRFLEKIIEKTKTATKKRRNWSFRIYKDVPDQKPRPTNPIKAMKSNGSM